MEPIFFQLPTDWCSPTTRPTTDSPNKQSAPRVNKVSLGGNTTTQNSYSDLKIKRQKARKSHSNKVCLSALWRLLFKYPGIYFQTSLGLMTVTGPERHRGQAASSLDGAVTVGAAHTDLLHISQVRQGGKSAADILFFCWDQIPSIKLILCLAYKTWTRLYQIDL